MEHILFRPEAVKAQQDNWLGEIILIRPVSFTFFTTFAVMLALCIVAFLIWGTYTKRSTVAGQLVPDAGLVKVYAPQPGIVVEKYVTEGGIVKQGDVLFVLNSERQSSTQGETQAAISRQVETRGRSFREEMDKTRLLQTEECDALLKKIAGLKAELSKLGSQIEVQKSRVRFAEETVSRHQGLYLQDNIISREQLQQKEEELLDQRSRLQGMERDSIAIQRELTAQKSELKNMPLKHRNLLAQIERNIASTGQELTESEAKRRLVIIAPESGTATAVIAEIGQAVETGKPLVSIVPRGAKLQAHLYVPSRAVGFIKPGDPVLLRYQAYPYQKFGHYKGVVSSVAKTTLLGNELPGLPSLSGNNEPLYRVIVNMNSQLINTYGKPQPLQAGMLLEADVLQDTRRLYEWVLEPLYSLTGKL